MMMIPRRNSFGLLDDLFKDTMLDRHESKLMRTDIKENENDYSVIIDLPGYEKEDIKIEVDEGYLTVTATKTSEDSQENSGRYVRKERYFGECSRSFYVGDNIETEDVKATFRNGTLNLSIPKKEEQEEEQPKKYVQIDD